MIFSRNIIEQEFLTYQKLEINMPQIFKTKCIFNFGKWRIRRRKRDLVKKKLVKLNKTEKAEELIAQY